MTNHGNNNTRAYYRARIRSLDADIEIHEALRDECESEMQREIGVITELRRDREKLVDQLIELDLQKEKERNGS
jgi:hypothetical protein